MYGTQQIIIKTILVVILTFISLKVIRTRSQRSEALRRIGIVLFIIGAFVSIFWPRTLSLVANKAGVGRGTDLLLYLLIVAFLASLANQYRRAQVLERQLTKLARQIALSDSPRFVRSKTGKAGLTRAGLDTCPLPPDEVGAHDAAPGSPLDLPDSGLPPSSAPAPSPLPGNGAAIGEAGSEDMDK